MPLPHLLQRLKLRHKIAALGVVGVALLVLPLVQFFRFQGLELQWALAERERIEPALLAVSLQRGLVDHALASRQVLDGQREVEPLRRAQQATVDARLAMLAHRLDAGPHLTAQAEAKDMRRDWGQLVQRVLTRGCTAAESDSGHRLLVEQTLQIIDIVSAALPASSDAQLAAVLGPLPRVLAASLSDALTAPQTTPQTTAQSLAATQALSAATARLQDEAAHTLARRIAWHEAQRAMAGCALLLAVLSLLAGLAWLRRHLALPPQPPGGLPPPAAPGSAAAKPPEAWSAPPADGQQAGRLAQQGLLQRLRGRRTPPARPRLDQPTQPQDG